MAENNEDDGQTIIVMELPEAIPVLSLPSLFLLALLLLTVGAVRLRP